MNNEFLTNEETIGFIWRWKMVVEKLPFIETTLSNTKFIRDFSIAIKRLFYKFWFIVIQSEDEIKYLLGKGIEKFIAKKRRHLVSITETAYPVKIKIRQKLK